MNAETVPKPRSSAWVRRVIIHPPLIAVFPVLSFYSAVAESVPPRHLVLPIALMLGVTAVLWALASLLTRSARKGALGTSVFLVVFWAFQDLLNLTQASEAAWALLALLLSLAFVAGVGALIWFVWRSHGDFEHVTAVVNLLSLAIVAMPILFMLPGWLRSGISETETISEQDRSTSVDQPSIYYIVLDGYGRADVLQRTYDVRQALAEELESMGFFVASRARANYWATIHSIPSALNLDFIQPLLADSDPREPSYVKLSRLACESRVRSELSKRGYRFIAYSSGFQATECSSADRFVEPGRSLSEFHAMVLARTPMLAHRLLRPYFNPYRIHRERILGVLADLPRWTSDREPVFVFAHLVSPHHPFVFGEEGEDVSPLGRPFKLNDGGVGGRPHDDPEARRQYVEGYRGQVRFLSSRVAATVEALLRDSEVPPIILVQGDHGPSSTWPEMQPQERFPILSAFYFPERRPTELYDSISPVNSFRVLFNHLFGTQLELLPDESYSSAYDDLMDFHRVTEEVGS